MRSRRTAILTTVGVAVIMLVIGVALGSFAFPTARTQTTTQISIVTQPVAVRNVTQTLTVTSTVSFPVTTTTLANTNSTSSLEVVTQQCTTGVIGCPHFLNQTFVITVDYGGPWGLSYQGYLGAGTTSGTPIESGNFFGHGSANESITVSGTSASGITACVEAQKLDASTSLLVLKLQTSTNLNQTSLPYGTAKACIAYAII